MRGCALILTSCLMLAHPAWSADISFPYTADVSLDEVEVRCGPAWEYYPTMRLKRGAKVEVYRHEPGGWLAIRPPQGSFSWIPARQVERASGARTGKVLIDGAVAWVGSDLASVVQHKWQVRLEQGELVEILGEASLSVGPGFATETYLKIAPPAGEFRWIHAEHATAPGAIAHRASSHTIELTDYADGPAGQTNTQAGSTGREAATDSSGASDESGDLQQLREQVDQLRLDLSLLVSQQIHQWDLQSLRKRAEALVGPAKGTTLARQVRLITYRIEEFETLQRRHRRMAENQGKLEEELKEEEEKRIEQHGVRVKPEATKSEVQPTSWQQDIEQALDSQQTVGTGIDRLAAEAAATEPSFDAQGWLMPVHSTRRVAPPFALLDDDGRVVCYVQPSPGLNLRRYAKKHVGLFGDRQFVPELRANLLTVTRVVRRSK